MDDRSMSISLLSVLLAATRTGRLPHLSLIWFWTRPLPPRPPGQGSRIHLLIVIPLIAAQGS